MSGMNEKAALIKGRVLIMDNDTELVANEAEVLTGAGFGVELAKDGAEAVEMYKKAREMERPFDVVLLDLDAGGGMGAIGTFKELLKVDHRIKAVISSGRLDDTVIDNFTRYGFQGILFKPCSSQRLLRVVSDAMQKGVRG